MAWVLKKIVANVVAGLGFHSDLGPWPAIHPNYNGLQFPFIITAIGVNEDAPKPKAKWGLGFLKVVGGVSTADVVDWSFALDLEVALPIMEDDAAIKKNDKQLYSSDSRMLVIRIGYQKIYNVYIFREFSRTLWSCHFVSILFSFSVNIRGTTP